MNFKTAVLRVPGEDFGSGETTAELGTPDFNKILVQHKEYTNVLKQLGLEVIVLDHLPGHPDAYFVEDTAVITPEIGIITNPGAQSRKGEEDGIELVLSKFMDTQRIKPPGTLDGGDIMQADNHFSEAIARFQEKVIIFPTLNETEGGTFVTTWFEEYLNRSVQAHRN